jgi:arogenate dehydrogenase (NADP+)
LQSKEAEKIGVEYYRSFESSKFLADLDVVVIAAPLIEFEETVQSLPVDSLKGKLIVDTSVLNSHPKSVMLRAFGDYPEIDILTSHPMLSPATPENPYTPSSWEGRPMVYEKVRVSNNSRCEKFLDIFAEARCQMVEMNAEQHDASIADAEFVTHLTGRLLSDKHLLPPTPVSSKEYAALCDVADMTAGDSFDLFFGMFKYNDRAKDHLDKMRDNLARLERQLAAKEAYLAASAEMRNTDRHRLLAETKLLLREVAKSGDLWAAREEGEEKKKKKKSSAANGTKDSNNKNSKQ